MKYKVGNLITAAQTGVVNVIAHQCNCFCAMGAGIAPQIAKNFPEAEQADNMTESGDFSKLGTNSYAYIMTPDGEQLLIANMYGQKAPSTTQRATDYKALRSCFEELRDYLFGIHTLSDRIDIGLPLIGCGLGGGEWPKVLEIIEDTLKSFNVTIYVLTAEEVTKAIQQVRLVKPKKRNVTKGIDGNNYWVAVNGKKVCEFNLMANENALTLQEKRYISEVNKGKQND